MDRLTDIFSDRSVSKTGRKLEKLYTAMVLAGAESFEKSKVLNIRQSYFHRGKISKEDIEVMNEYWHKYKRGLKRLE